MSDASAAKPGFEKSVEEQKEKERKRENRKRERKDEERKTVFAIVAATATWVALFCAGATVETELARFILAPLDALSQKRDDESCKRLAALAGLDVSLGSGIAPKSGGQANADAPKATVNSGGQAAMVAASLVSSPSEASSENSPNAKLGSKPEVAVELPLRDRLAAWAGGRGITNASPPNKLTAFVTCLLCYSPINIALLSAMAGLIGGCASNLYYRSSRIYRGSVRVASGQSPRNTAVAESLREHPAISAVRGLVGYILILAGVYAVFDDPFKNPTTTQYTKLAGVASALAFTLGYDGTRLTRLLESVTKQPPQADAVRSPGESAPRQGAGPTTEKTA